MGRTSVREGIDVVLETRTVRVGWGDVLTHSGPQKLCVMDPLCAREDLLSAHEEVERITVPCVCILGGHIRFVRWRVRGGHGVEGPDGEGVLVQNVKVRTVLLEDQAAETLLIGSAVPVSD